MVEQGYDIKQNILFQDNQSAIKMEKKGKKSCTGNSRHIDIHYLFAKNRIERNKISIAYCSTEHMLTDFFTKALQGSLFANFCDVIMGWKHVDTLQMGPSSTKERVGGVVKFRSNQEDIDSNMDTGEESIKYSVDTGGYRTVYNVETKDNGKKKCLHNAETKEKGKEMNKSYAEIFRG